MRSSAALLLAACSLSFLLLAAGQPLSNVVIEVSGTRFFAASSTSAGSVEKILGFEGDEGRRSDQELLLLYPIEEELKNGCGLETEDNVSLEAPSLVNEETEFAVLFDRGGCSFETKMKTGSEIGAKVVLIANQVENIFNKSSGFLRNPCAVDCELANALDEDDCAASSRCGSNLCLPAFLDEDLDSRTTCCVVEGLIDITFNGSTPAETRSFRKH